MTLKQIKSELDVIGMTCAACSNRIEKVLNKTTGVKQATVKSNHRTSNDAIIIQVKLMLIRSLDEYNISAMMLNLNNQKEQASRKVQN